MRPLGSPPDEPDPQAYVILTAAVTLSIPNAAEPSNRTSDEFVLPRSLRTTRG